MVAAGVFGLLLLYAVALVTVAASRAQLFRVAPRSVELGDNETTGRRMVFRSSNGGCKTESPNRPEGC